MQRAWIGAMVIAVLLAACAPSGDVAPPPQQPAPSGWNARTALLPDAASQQRDRRITVATERLIKTCMASAGQQYPDPPAGFRDESPTWATASAMPDGVPSGYGLAGGLTFPQVDRLRTTARKVLVGSGRTRAVELPSGVRINVTTNGCAARARLAVFGSEDAEVAPLVVTDIRNTVLTAVQNAPEVNGAATAWSACMANAGVQAGTPVDAIVWLRNRYASGEDPASVEVAERATSAADAACERSAGYREAMGRAALAELGQHPDLVDRLWAADRQIAAAAAAG